MMTNVNYDSHWGSIWNGSIVTECDACGGRATAIVNSPVACGLCELHREELEPELQKIRALRDAEDREYWKLNELKKNPGYFDMDSSGIAKAVQPLMEARHQLEAGQEEFKRKLAEMKGRA